MLLPLSVIGTMQICEKLATRGYREEGNGVVSIDGIRVRFSQVHDALLEEALLRTEKITWEGVTTYVLTAEYLVAIYLQTGRDEEVRRFRTQGKANPWTVEEIAGRFLLADRWRAQFPD